MNITDLSNTAMVMATAVYAFATLAHIIEWTSARAVGAPGRVRQDAPVLVGAGGPASDTRVVEHHGADDADDTPLRSEKAGRSAVALTLIAVVLHALAVVTRGMDAGRFPWGNMYEFVSTSLLFVVIVHLFLVVRSGQRWLGLLVTALSTIGLGLAVTVFYVAVSPLVPSLESPWFVPHIVAAAISGAGFNVGALATILYLVKSAAERRGDVRGYLTKLPSARAIDRLAYTSLAISFPIWTLVIALGAIWAQDAWGRFWGWDPKETMSLVTWVVYAVYLHARATAGWRGRPAAIIALVGVVAFWFNFIGINLLVKGLHSYAGI